MKRDDTYGEDLNIVYVGSLSYGRALSVAIFLSKPKPGGLTMKRWPRLWIERSVSLSGVLTKPNRTGEPEATTFRRRSSVGPGSSMRSIPIVLTLCIFSMAADKAQSQERTGKDVVTSTCSACHATGKNGAPRIGDKKAWGKVASQGLTSLTQVALDGIRQMPPHGANLQLTDTEIKRAVTYMVNRSGGNWTEPIDKKHPPAARTGEQIVQARCSNCHEKGLHGAPKIGDREAWNPRLKDGLDATVRSAINGHGAMPARGGLANLTDAEVREAIVYMINKGATTPKASK